MITFLKKSASKRITFCLLTRLSRKMNEPKEVLQKWMNKEGRKIVTQG